MFEGVVVAFFALLFVALFVAIPCLILTVYLFEPTPYIRNVKFVINLLVKSGYNTEKTIKIIRLYESQSMFDTDQVPSSA